ncbi:MAG: hypothetical protein FE78DRAFT_41589 [Acidomyces sp. 'richmondensis']|nr:MAG: hypothetical protein FE78DRAFT_41589 [Acidomyces sp. 'richmondensis']
MPRKQFIADLQKAQSSVLPLGVANLKQGEDDGQFEFVFTGNPVAPLAAPLRITAMVLDLGDYPKLHEYLIYCGDDAPEEIASGLQNLRCINRKSVLELIDIVSTALVKASPDNKGDISMVDSRLDDADADADADDEGTLEEEVDDDDNDDDDNDDIYSSDHEAFKISAEQCSTPFAVPTPSIKLKPSDRQFRARVRADLRTAKEAGFKVGHLGHLLEGFNSFVTVSVRISKLGISDEAMQAWRICPTEYLILILHYPNGYKTNEELQNFDSIRLPPNIGFRVAMSRAYKPTLQEAIRSFTLAKKERDSIASVTELSPVEEADEKKTLRDAFISKPLNSLLQERLVPILRYRSAGMDWRGAEEWYNEITSKGASGADAVPDRHFQPETLSKVLPSLVIADHCKQHSCTQLSFPLLAMQFLLRHFVRCPDFCLVCHRQLDSDVEAIKPYVCESHLCLYQYMTLGFGPSIEHEILAQPYVVDLLTSFCYSSAAARKLKEYPDGLALMVPAVPDPSLPSHHVHPAAEGYKREVHPPPLPLPTHDVGFDRSGLEIIFYDNEKPCPVRKGNWMVLKEQNTVNTEEIHCRVADVNFYPVVKIDEPVILQIDFSNSHLMSTAHVPSPKPVTITPATTPRYTPASFQIYEQDFEQLNDADKCASICKLLQTLPNVREMQDYLTRNQSSDLRHWVERISPAALSLLRWIIASNRACIMQVDGHGTSTSAPQERLFGMKDHMQFRFAMGAPDKEQRFVNEVRQATERLKLTYPTIFAFHGSPLWNWHMIIREGLHYRNADHGRAYGHGVYHSKEAQISMSYSGANVRSYGGANNNMKSWPNSLLNVTSAVALNEVVNVPSEFTSSNPYYVVQHLSWIQTRYLFIQCSPTLDGIKPSEEIKPTNAHPQDPQLTPIGISGSIIIPASAISSTRAVRDGMFRVPGHRLIGQNPVKKYKGAGGAGKPNQLDCEEDSGTDPEDLKIFNEDEDVYFETKDPHTTSVIIAPLRYTLDGTDFQPGTLDFSSLPVMPVPEYAVSSTTTTLMKELQKLNRLQDATPLSDLGWYIDIENVENVYQWIVELHSFHIIDAKLPLVSDMKKQKLKSIVLEIRFNKDFPFTPPYVRVIRPRFLSRMQGGGGHIVLGGALCMELLTNTGWSSVSSMESVLMQIRLAIASDPPARLDGNGIRGDYGVREAAEGYMRACQTHGWTVPPGFKEMAYASSSSGKGL